jgi:imidazolonepropionase-like amidohydrolase
VQTPRTALVAARLIDGTGAAAVDDATLVIEGDRIASVGPSRATRVPDGARRIDLGGRTLMPGLIDGHIHISGEWRADPGAPLQGLPEYAAIRSAAAARLLLDAGFTSARAMSSVGYTNVALKLAIDRGLVPGPRLLCAGPMLRPVGAYGGTWAPPTPYPTAPDVMIGSAADARRAVRLQHAYGVDFVECTISGLVGTSHGTTPLETTIWSIDEMRAAVDEAHRLRHPITANCYGDESVELCVEAGFDVIEHGCLITERGMDALARSRTPIDPTLCAYHAYVAADAHESYPPWQIEHGVRVERVLRERLRSYLPRGVRLFGGSDGALPGTGRRPGEGALELALMVEYGLTPMEAIVANTKTCAEVMGWADRLGTLEAGKLADLIVVDGDPLADISVLQRSERIVLVMRGGQVHRSALA